MPRKVVLDSIALGQVHAFISHLTAPLKIISKLKNSSSTPSTPPIGDKNACQCSFQSALLIFISVARAAGQFQWEASLQRPIFLLLETLEKLLEKDSNQET